MTLNEILLLLEFEPGVAPVINALGADFKTAQISNYLFICTKIDEPEQ